jgi:two-component system LytT family sensor kinase
MDFFQFRIVIPAIFLLLITGLIYIYIKQLNQRAAQKQDALRLKSLQGQMNPHFIFNSLNSINYFVSKNDALPANRYIADFSKLIRSIL